VTSAAGATEFGVKEGSTMSDATRANQRQIMGNQALLEGYLKTTLRNQGKLDKKLDKILANQAKLLKLVKEDD
jgi:3-oxoacyl-ACP reductase-like protein